MENKMQLTQNDYNNISNIAINHNLDTAIVEKLYKEMLYKANAQKKLKELLEKAKAK